jgi:superkiller protein 3
METAGWNFNFEQQSEQNWFEKGETALGASNHPEAERCFAMALKADPFNAKAHSRMSKVYWAQGKTEEALNSIKRALELEPYNRDTVLMCDHIFTAFGKDDFAIDVLRSYLEKNPQDGEVRSRLERAAPPTDPAPFDSDVAAFFLRQGEIQFERGNMAHAEACFEMAVEENPLLAEAFNDLGVIGLESGKLVKALENFFRALELKPEDPEILGNSAKGLAKAGQIDAAIGVYREYLRRSPRDNDAWFEFESLVRQTVAPEWKPDGFTSEVADIYLDMAAKLKNAGDLTGAAGAIERSLRIKPEAPDSLYLLASLHCAIGQKDEAEKVLDLALKLDPSHEPCSELLESVRAQDHEKQNAAAPAQDLN